MQVVGSNKALMVAPLVRTAQLLVSWRLLRLAAPAYLLLMLVVWGVLLLLWFGGADGRDRSGVVLGPDFPAFYTGGLLVRHSDSLRMYDLGQQQELQQQVLPGIALSAFVNPPHYAFVAAPFSLLGYSTAFALWSALMLAAFGGSVWLLRAVAPTLQAGGGWLLMALALLAAPVYFALSAGQNTGLSLLLHTGILLALVNRRDWLAGLLIALGMFKPQLFVGLLPLLLLGRHWRALVSFGVGALLISGLTVWFFGWSTLHDWMRLLQSPEYQHEEVRQAVKMFSWQPVWLLLLGPSVGANVLGWLCALGVFAGLCWLWWRGSGDLPLRYAITLLGLVVMGPHLPVYDLALLILPGLVLTDRVLRLPPQHGMALRVSLLALFVLTLFAATVELRASLVLVPLITLVAWLAARLSAASAQSAS